MPCNLWKLSKTIKRWNILPKSTNYLSKFFFCIFKFCLALNQYFRKHNIKKRNSQITRLMDGNCHRNVWNHLRREDWVSQKAHGYSFNLYPQARGNAVLPWIAVSSNIHSILTYFHCKGTSDLPITGRIWCVGHIAKNIWKWTTWNCKRNWNM